MPVLDLRSKILNLRRAQNEGKFTPAGRSLIAYLMTPPGLLKHVRLAKAPGYAPNYLIIGEEGLEPTYQFFCGVGEKTEIMSKGGNLSETDILTLATEGYTEVPLEEARMRLKQLSRTEESLVVVVRFVQTPDWWVYEDNPYDMDMEEYRNLVAQVEEARQKLKREYREYIDAVCDYVSSWNAIEHALEVKDRDLFLKARKEWLQAKSHLDHADLFKNGKAQSVYRQLPGYTG